MCLLFYIPCQKKRKYFLRLATLILGMTVPSSSQPQEETGAAGELYLINYLFRKRNVNGLLQKKKKKYKTISLLRIEQKNPNQPTKTQSKPNQKTTQKINQPTNQPANKSTKKSHKKGHCKEISPQGILASCNYN